MMRVVAGEDSGEEERGEEGEGWEGRLDEVCWDGDGVWKGVGGRHTLATLGQ